MELDALLWRLDALRVPKAGILESGPHGKVIVCIAIVCPRLSGLEIRTCIWKQSLTCPSFFPQEFVVLVLLVIWSTPAYPRVSEMGWSCGLPVHGSKFLYKFRPPRMSSTSNSLLAPATCMHAAMSEIYTSLRFDILDHDAEPGRTNFMGFNSVSGYAWST